MLNLPNVTLVALTSLDWEGHKEALDKSSEGIEWGAKKIIWDETIKSIDDWNYNIIYELHNYISTDYAMLIHADGYVIDPDAWDDSFLEFDYVGAPWPLPNDTYSYRTPVGELVRVGNSVSLRSKKILELPGKLGLEWKSYHGNTNEDGFLTCHNRDVLKEHGIKFAPIEIAKSFSREHDMPENEGIKTFAFHSL